MRDVFREVGFSVRTDEDLLSIARRIASPRTHARSLGNGRIAVAETA
jgi:hypothetical protein